MCRMMLANKEGIKYIEGMTGLLKFLDQLEESCGGHGNGYSLIFKNSSRKVVKGVKLDNTIIKKDVLENLDNLKWFIYHTRLASEGSIADANCHPFTLNNRLLCMNGTETSVKPFIKGSKTDTETILELACKQGLNLFKTVGNFNSAFFGIENNKVFATKGTGSLHLLEVNKAIVFASEFPTFYYTCGLIWEAPKAWIEGQAIPANLILAKEAPKYYYYGDYGVYGNYKVKKVETAKSYAVTTPVTTKTAGVGDVGTANTTATETTNLSNYPYVKGTKKYWEKMEEEARQNLLEQEAEEIARQEAIEAEYTQRQEDYLSLFADTDEVLEKMKMAL